MNPEIETMLEDAFEPIQPVSTTVGRVAVEPDYESGLTPAETPQIRAELEKLLQGVKLSATDIASHDGQNIDFSGSSLLSRYLRKISLHGGEADTPWVEVVPPGNWI